MPDIETMIWFYSLGSTVEPNIPEIWTFIDNIVQHTPAETEIIKLDNDF